MITCNGRQDFMKPNKKILILSVLIIGGCASVGPDYQDPKLKVSKNWLYTSKSNRAAVKIAQKKHAKWWKAFHDKTLERLIEKGYKDNLSLQSAGVNVLLNRANLAMSIGQQYPQKYLSGDYKYNVLGGSSLGTLIPNSFNSALLGISLNWEIDFWGKYRRAVQSSDASFLSSIAAYDNALVILLSEVANTYINIRTLEELIWVTRRNVAAQKDSLEIVKTRYRTGQTSQLDVEQAKTQLGQTQAQLPTQLSNLQVAKDKLAVLLGVTPEEVSQYLKGRKVIPRVIKQIETPLPKEILAQRSDVAEARLQAMANSASIGVSKAELYPAFSLSGSFNFSSTNIGRSNINDMFAWSHRNINAGPAFSMPIFNYSQVLNSVRMKDAVFQQSLLNYQNVVLKAQQEVQDAIAQYVNLKDARYILSKTNHSAHEATRLALVRYRSGETNYTSVLDALKTQLKVESDQTQVRGDLALALSSLFKALGGGWQIRVGHDVVSEEIKQQMAKRTNWGSLLKTNLPVKG